MSDMLRITGLVSGMDTDTTVKKLIQAEQVKVDKVRQEKQYMEWQKDDYREVANLLRGFQDEFFDYLNPATNMQSSSTFNMFQGSSSIAGVTSDAVSIKTSSSSIVGSFTINSVEHLATKDSYVSAEEVMSDITSGKMGTEATAIAAIKVQLGNDNTMSFTLDGVTKEISFDPTEYDEVGEMDTYAQFADLISTKLKAEFTNVDITAEMAVDQMTFKIYKNDTTTDETGHVFTIVNDNSDLLNIMKLSAGQSNTVNTSETLAEVFGKSGNSTFTINDVAFSFAEDATISEVMSEINSSSADVTLSYDGFSDNFTLESNQVGSDSAINLVDGAAGLFSDFKLQGVEGVDFVHTAAENAEFVVNGVTTTRSSNTFEISGTVVTLNSKPVGAVDIDITSDPTDVKDMIVKFVDKYNDMISEINDLVTSSRNYDYDPLTTEQKEVMSDDDIESWEMEAKKGTLRGDATLSRLTEALRTSLYESVDGVGISLYEIGIQTSSNYKEQGKLIVDEDKLDAALKDRPSEVIQLFTKESSTEYTSFSERGTRSAENGLAYRLSDILKDNIRITRDNNGSKGYLIEKAGLETGVDATSDMAKKLLDMDDKINGSCNVEVI